MDRVGRRFDLRPQRLAADTAYGAVRLLKWLVDRRSPHTSRSGTSRHADGTFSRADFVFDRERNVYICPGGKLLHTHRQLIDQGHASSVIGLSKATASAARSSPSVRRTRLREDHPRHSMRTCAMHVRALAKTEASEQSRRERKKVEMLFAHMKRILKLDRLRLRGLSGARDEVLLTATAQNLRRLVKFLCRPPPSTAFPCAA